MNSIHDYEVERYSIDFKKNTIVIEVSYKENKKQIIFHSVFCHKFYEEMAYSIVSDIEERPIENFFTENKDLLTQTKSYAWPIMYDTLQELEEKIKDSGVHYHVLSSAYGLNGWVLAERVEIIDVK